MSQGMRKHHCPKFVEKQNHRSQIDGIDGGDSAMSGVDTGIIMASSRTATATRLILAHPHDHHPSDPPTASV